MVWIRFAAIVGVLSLGASNGFAETACEGTSTSASLIRSLYTEFLGIIQKMRCSDCANMHVSCDLSRLEPLPEIILIGEDHVNPTSGLVKNQLLEMGLQKKIVLASEIGPSGGFPGWKADRADGTVHGIESSIPYSVLGSYLIQENRLRGKRYGIKSAILHILDYPLHRFAYEKFKSETLKSSNADRFSAIFKEIDLFIELSSTEKGLSDGSPLVHAMTTLGSMPAEMNLFLDSMHRLVIQTANEKYLDRLGGDPLPVVKTEKDLDDIGFEGNRYIPGSRIDKLILGVRNRDFSAEVANLLCHYSGKSPGKSQKVFVLVGAAHSDGVEEYLKSLSSNRIKIKKFKSFDPGDAATLFKTFFPELGGILPIFGAGNGAH